MDLSITGMDHCGNSPRMMAVGELVTAWARRDRDALAAVLADDVVCEDSRGDVFTGREAVQQKFRAPEARHLEIRSLCNHGKVAAADGVLTLDDGNHVAFSHHFTYSGVTKTALVTSIRSYSRIS